MGGSSGAAGGAGSVLGAIGGRMSIRGTGGGSFFWFMFRRASDAISEKNPISITSSLQDGIGLNKYAFPAALLSAQQ